MSRSESLDDYIHREVWGKMCGRVFEHRSVNGSRANRIDANAIGCVVNGERPCQAKKPALRSSICGNPALAPMSLNSRDNNHRSPPTLYHFPNPDLSHQL